MAGQLQKGGLSGGVLGRASLLCALCCRNCSLRSHRALRLRTASGRMGYERPFTVASRITRVLSRSTGKSANREDRMRFQ